MSPRWFIPAHQVLYINIRELFCLCNPQPLLHISLAIWIHSVYRCRCIGYPSVILPCHPSPLQSDVYFSWIAWMVALQVRYLRQCSRCRSDRHIRHIRWCIIMFIMVIMVIIRWQLWLGSPRFCSFLFFSISTFPICRHIWSWNL